MKTNTNELNVNVGQRCAGLKSGFIVVLSALLLSIGSPVFAQTGYDEKIQALEKELDEIKASARGGEDTAARVEALEDELAKLKKQIDEDTTGQQSQADESASTVPELPEAGLQGAPNPLQDDKKYLTGDDLLDDSFPNSIPIPGSKVRFAVGGYAKLDFIQDLDYVGSKYEFLLASIPVDGTPASQLDGQTTIHAKETRINFDFRSKAKWKDGKQFPMQVFLEFDFFDDRETFALQPRLRHAYGVIGRILAGQTWSVTTDVTALAGTIDFAGGDALYGGRVAQVRFEDRINDSLKWAVGVEEAQLSIDNPSGVEGVNRTSLPNLAGRLRWEGQKGHFQLGADVFQVEWQGGATGPSDTEMGYGAVISGRYLVGSGKRDAIVGAATIGSGAANRVISMAVDGGNSAVITPDGLDTMSHRQVYGGYSHYWSQSLNSTVSAAWAELDNSDFQANDAIRRAKSFHINLIWFPYKLVSTGGEVMWGERVNKDGARGEAWRLQYMVKFKFN